MPLQGVFEGFGDPAPRGAGTARPGQLELRSFLDVMFFLEQNKWVPEAHRDPVKEVESKDTFAWLKILFQMQAGDVKTMEPFLTIPLAES